MLNSKYMLYRIYMDVFNAKMCKIENFCKTYRNFHSLTLYVRKINKKYCSRHSLYSHRLGFNK